MTIQRKSSAPGVNADATATAARVGDWLAQARRCLVLTGAGMSAESGIAPFRGGDQALWTRFDPARLATPEAFAADPDLVWAWYLWRMAGVRAAAPHAGHRALAALAGRHPHLVLATQNVDDLHERAGSAGVVHLHGELFALRCAACAAPAPVPALPQAGMAPALRQPPPRCRRCGGAVRPGVVWFGEALPEAAWQAAEAAARACDLVLVVGTSGLVHPASTLPAIARRRGARVVEINPAPTALSGAADLCWRATAAQALPLLTDASAEPGG